MSPNSIHCVPKFIDRLSYFRNAYFRTDSGTQHDLQLGFDNFLSARRRRASASEANRSTAPQAGRLQVRVASPAARRAPQDTGIGGRGFRFARSHAISSVSSVCRFNLQFWITRRWFTARFLKKQKKMHDGMRTNYVCLRTRRALSASRT